MVNELITPGLNWEQIYNVYHNNNEKLANDLMEIGLISSEIPKCTKIDKHNKKIIKNMKPNFNKWEWKCTDSKCRSKKSFNTINSFLRNMKKPILVILKAIYMWINEYKNDQISYECGVDIHTITQWNIY